MGGALYGPYMRISILISITVSQIGFVCGKLSDPRASTGQQLTRQHTPSLSPRTFKHSSWP